MTTFISMLRGINVGGQKRVPMKELVEVYESLGFKRVRTYIQSGNVLFEGSGNDSAALAVKIERSIKGRFGFDVPVIIRTREELQGVIDETPFAGKDDAKVHVTFMSAAPADPNSEEINKARGRSEEFAISGREIYLFCPNGYGVTKMSNAFLERELRVTATTRNWRTVNLLSSMAKQSS